LCAHSIACAEISQFIETFDGVGEYGLEQHTTIDFGLDNPDWLYFSSGGFAELQDGSLQFAHTGIGGEILNGEGSNISRSLLPDVESFIERVEIRDLDLGVIEEREHPEAVSGIALTHIFGFSGISVSVSLEDDNDTWLLSLITDRDPIVQAIPRGDHLALEILFDAMTSEIRFTYDNDIGDESPPFEFGPVLFTSDVNTPHRTKVSFGASGGSNRVANGLLDYWSFTKLVIPGDYDDDHLLTVADVDLLMTRVREGPFGSNYDLNDDNKLDFSDVRTWVEDLKGTYLGDANLDGEFNSTDLVAIFQAGEYHDDITMKSTWATGDWNADGEFKSGDLVFAFAGGGYDFGPRAAARTVPEPTSTVALLTGLIALAIVSNCRPEGRLIFDML
jgi:hypothetical protein